MEEVEARLRFTRECLGSARDKANIFRMLRGPDGRVMFLPSWWRDRMVYAAQVTNQSADLVRKIDWDPFIDGKPVGGWRRTLPAEKGRRRCYAIHEAFRRGDVIAVRAVLPDGLSREVFHRLLSVVGTYRGISPFRAENPYGTFEVLSVGPPGADT